MLLILLIHNNFVNKNIKIGIKIARGYKKKEEIEVGLFREQIYSNG